MSNTSSHTFTLFEGNRRIASDLLQVLALKLKWAVDSGFAGPFFVFEDSTGRLTDINPRGSDEEVLARLPQPELAEVRAGEEEAGLENRGEEPRGRGRPKLGVVAREITLLPRHWEWLATQSGGASVAIRKLVEEARRTHAAKDRSRLAQERAYRFMSAMAGDLPDFEEASRALFANDRARLVGCVGAWPEDVRDYAVRLAFGDDTRLTGSEK